MTSGPSTEPPATVYRGHLFTIAGSAALATATDSLVSLPDGALAVAPDGTIGWVGPYADLPEAYASAPVVTAGFILPGFVDTHLHYPQTFATDAYGGGQLLEWLNRCVFPTEAGLADPAVAARTAEHFTRRRIAAGTTAAMVFGSAFPDAQDALFEASRDAGLRLVSGRGIQTVGPSPAAPLLTSETAAIELAAAEIERWHCADAPGQPDRALLQVAVVPRFSLSVTRTTLAALGELYTEVRPRGVYFHSHLSENDRPVDGEVAAVAAAYGTKTYLDTYDGHFQPGSRRGGASLLGRRSIVAHAVHCTDGELARLAETGSSIAHCPTSQQFLGSGTMPWRRTAASGVQLSIGSDIGGGDEWLIPRVLNDAYKVHLSEPGPASVALPPAELLYLGTLAGAQALDMADRFGALVVGHDADFVLIDPDRWPPLAATLAYGTRAFDAQAAAEQTLFALLMGLREPAITATYVRGRRLNRAGAN